MLNPIGIKLQSIHLRKSFRPVYVCGFWIDEKLTWGDHGCQIFDYGSRIVIRVPQRNDEFIYPWALRSAMLRDPLDTHLVIKPNEQSVGSQTPAQPPRPRGRPAKKKSPMQERLIQNDRGKPKED